MTEDKYAGLRKMIVAVEDAVEWTTSFYSLPLELVPSVKELLAERDALVSKIDRLEETIISLSDQQPGHTLMNPDSTYRELTEEERHRIGNLTNGVPVFGVDGKVCGILE